MNTKIMGLAVGVLFMASLGFAQEKTAAICLKASDLKLKDGEKVTKWVDSLGRKVEAVQANGDLAPVYKEKGLNGRSAVSFNGKAWLGIFAKPSLTDYTYIAAVQGTGDGALLTAVQPVVPETGYNDRQFGNKDNKFSHRVWADETASAEVSAFDGKPHVMAVTVNKEGIRLYLDGKLVGRGQKTASDADAAEGLVIGGHIWWGFVNADLAELQVLDKALDENGVKELSDKLASSYIK